MNITGGIYNGRKVQAHDEKITRPTLSKVRMSVFNSLYSELSHTLVISKEVVTSIL